MQKLMQLKNYLHELSFSALIFKVLYSGAGYGEALILIFLVISMCYKHWIKQKTEDQFQSLKEQMESDKRALEIKYEQYHKETSEKFDNIFSKFNAQNLENGLRKKGNELANLANNIERLEKSINISPGVDNAQEKRRLF